MATKKATTTKPAPDVLPVRIVPSLLRDYRERNVFPTLRVDTAYRVAGAVTFDVPLAMAAELLEDARTQHARPFGHEVRKGTKSSYLWLIKALQRALEPQAEIVPPVLPSAAGPSEHEASILARLERLNDEIDRGVRAMIAAPGRDDGLWDDPGIEAVRARMADTPARFHVGQTVRYWSPFTGDKCDGGLLEIVEEYGIYSVHDDDGPFIDDEGNRRCFQPGYVAQPRGGKPTFYPAHQIQSVDYKHRHLRLVTPAQHGTA